MKTTIRVKRNSADSMTRQIREQIAEAIEAGKLVAGTIVWSERELANQLDVARNVVRGAYEQLMEAGKLQSEGRKGRSVRSSKKKSSAKKASKTSKASKKTSKARKK